jgi:hypothetical protein
MVQYNVSHLLASWKEVSYEVRNEVVRGGKEAHTIFPSGINETIPEQRQTGRLL